MSDPKPTLGTRLKAEREQRGMSVERAADEMRMDAWAIDALEAGDYERIGPMVYVKGHLKRYAAMLGLPVDEIMSDFEPASPAAAVRERRKFPRHTRAPSRTVSPTQAAAALAAALALIGLVWWQPWDRRERATASTSAASAAPSRAPESAADDGVSEPTAERGTPLAAAQSGGGVVNVSARAAPLGGVGAASAPAAMGGAAAPGAAAEAKAASPPARARLRLSFTADSWVDVRDATGRQAFAGNGAANTVKTIAGTAPLHVYLRSASGVQLEINGRAVAIGPQFFSGDVARFEADADGVLRREQTPARPPG